MLVLERLVEALAHAVGLRRVVAGADVLELGPLGHEPGEAQTLEGRAIVGDHDQALELAGGRVEALVEKRSMASAAAVRPRTATPRQTLVT
ncbi:MAG: hypothetical protein QOF11_1702 [Chloroflexota bacterium]|nr:hypothetical protein [Chloroflexota bacterium]